MVSLIAQFISTATIAIALFGIALSFIQPRHSGVRRSFAVFLGAVAINNIPDAFDRSLAALPDTYAQAAELLIWAPSALCLAPLFWVYVVSLTSPKQQPPAHMHRHFLLPALGVLVGALVVGAGPENGAEPLPGWLLALHLTAGMLAIVLYPQMAIYLILIVRRMVGYRLMLRDFYASTERYELRWVYWIGGLAGLFWLARAVLFLFALDADWKDTPPEIVSIAGLASLFLVAALTLWGVRQRPPFSPDDDDVPDERSELPPAQKRGKYEKSALSTEASSRIARKLRAAMEVEHLYRDPNLSLWALARRVGASPNYISQTLSEDVGESFFDFVNGYRIKEAMTLLSTTNETVLAITYDVGFNARSSFYNAFKRVTGQTPSSYRKIMSRPIGMDDRAG